MRDKCLLKYKLTMSLNTNFYLDAYTRPENELLSNRDILKRYLAMNIGV